MGKGCPCSISTCGGAVKGKGPLEEKKSGKYGRDLREKRGEQKVLSCVMGKMSGAKGGDKG